MKNENSSGSAPRQAVHEAYRRAALEIVTEGQDAERLRLKILSNSMAPFLHPGDSVIVAPLIPGIILQRGDIIVFRQSNSDESGTPLTHRLIGRSAGGWVTKGDYRLLPDNPVMARDVLGKVIAVQRSQHLVDIGTQSWCLVNRLLGWFHFGVGSLMTVASRFRRKFDQRSV